MSIERTDVAIIGGGYYGAYVANEVKAHNPALNVVVLEKEKELFTRASSTNQGQFHMGYMYNADPALAEECAENIDKFSSAFGDAVDEEVDSLYGIHESSEMSADEYVNFCNTLGLPLESIERPDDIFGSEVTSAFRSAEKTFNSAELQKILMKKLARNSILLTTNFDAQTVEGTEGRIRVRNKDGDAIEADHVFNVTFADINELHERSGLPRIPLQYDTFLHFLVDLPDGYKNTAATVIRGLYASLLPSRFRQGHILASGGHRRVRSTTMGKPSEEIALTEVKAVYDRAVEDAHSYMPLLNKAALRGYTIGTRAAHFDVQTGRYTSKALVFRNFGDTANYHTVLGGKVSCMFDISKDLADTIS